MLLAADPDAATHQAFGVPAFDFVEGENAALWPFRFTMQQFRSVLINPTGEMPSPRNGFEANPVLNEKDGFQPTRSTNRSSPPKAAARTAYSGKWPVDEEILSAADLATGG